MVKRGCLIAVLACCVVIFWVGEVSALVISAAAPDDSISRQIRAGEYEEAHAAAKAALEDGQGPRQARLYQAGVAGLHRAAAMSPGEARTQAMLDAGLLLSELVHASPQSRLGDAALVELGLLHHHLGRRELAERIYNRADTALTADLPLRNRLRDLQARLARGQTP
ncbi:MAG: hypothetical protein JJU36_10440 [Phycisphaeraceae bacterium]|nr:hypothetical protein [Phycisphaeraceae bacterium]